MKKHIPNLFTLLNLFSGCMGVVFAFTSDLRLVSLMIFISLILDYLDGFMARLLDAKSPVGKELDSLADVVSFGLLPGIIVYRLLHAGELSHLAFIGFLMTLMSAYRLANFNIDTRQSESFIGLPTPANALFWSAFPLILFGNVSGVLESSIAGFIQQPYALLGMTLLFSYLLVAELPLFSLKFKNLSWEENKARHIFLFSCLLLILFLSYYALPFIILLYLLISVVNNKVQNT